MSSSERTITLRRVRDHALAYAREHQRDDGSWAIAPEPRVLENALVVHCVRRAGVAIDLDATVRWLRDHRPNDGGHPLARAIEHWLWELATGATCDRLELGDAGADQPQLGRRRLLVDALAVERGLADVTAVRAALADRLEQAATAKPWSAAEEAALYLIVGGGALRERALAIIARAQTETGSIADNPISTALALWGATSAGATTLAEGCLDYLRAVRIAGTWRFCMTEVWDTALLTRSLIAAGVTGAMVDRARGFLLDAQRSDGGWAYARGRDADIDSTAMALCALPSDATDARRRGLEYLRSRRDAHGLWPTWNDKHDPVAADVVGHAVSALLHIGAPREDHARATAWLVQRFERDGGWRADWYDNRHYAQYEIGAALGFEHPIVQGLATRLGGEQCADGGFAPVADAPSSPVSTGCALALLGTHVDADDPGYLRAVDYLLATARADGTWPGPTGMFGPRPFVSDYAMQTHALALLGLGPILRADAARAQSEEVATMLFPQLDAAWREVAVGVAAWVIATDDVLEAHRDVATARTRADRISAREGALGRALDRIAHALTALAPRRQVSALVAHADEFLDACVWEAGNRAADRPPSPEAYRRMRPHTGAMSLFIRVALAAHDVPLDVEAALDAMLAEIAWLPCLANDLVSCDKERTAGDFHNAVILGERAGNADARAEIHASYTAARDALPARLAAAPLDASARDALWALVAGADRWLVASARY